jgi:hypothetical protein
MPGRDFERVKTLPVLAVARLRRLIAQEMVVDVARGIELVQRKSAARIDSTLIQKITGDGQPKRGHQGSVNKRLSGTFSAFLEKLIRRTTEMSR